MNYESISERNQNDNSIIDKAQKKFITMTP